MSDDFDEIERIADMRRPDHVGGSRRGISPKANAAQKRNLDIGRARSHRPFARWAQRKAAPITLPKIKAPETE